MVVSSLERIEAQSKVFMLTVDIYRHLMTGIGAYFYIVWGIWLRHCLNGRQEEYDLVWPKLWSLPEIIRVNRANGNPQHDTAKKRL